MNSKPYKIFAFLYSLAIVLVLMPCLANAQETSADFSGGSVKVGSDNRACAAGLTGNVRYDTTNKCMNICDGSTWSNCTNTPPELMWNVTADRGVDCTDEDERGVLPSILRSPNCNYTTGANDLEGIQINGGTSNTNENLIWSYGADFISGEDYSAQFTVNFAATPSLNQASIAEVRDSGGGRTWSIWANDTANLMLTCDYNGSGWNDSITFAGTISTGVLYKVWLHNIGTALTVRLCNGSTLVEQQTCNPGGNQSIDFVRIGNGNITADNFDYTVDDFSIFKGYLDPPC